MAQRAETTVAECSLTNSVWARFRIGSHTLCLDSGIHSPLWLRWVKGVCVSRCNLPPALLAEWPGSFTRQNKESAHAVNSGEENSPAAPAGIPTRNLSITGPALYQPAISWECVQTTMNDNYYVIWAVARFSWILSNSWAKEKVFWEPIWMQEWTLWTKCQRADCHVPDCGISEGEGPFSEFVFVFFICL